MAANRLIIGADDFASLRVEGKRFELCLKLDLLPLILRKQFFHGQLLASHVLNPANNLELFFYHAVSRVGKLVPVAMAAGKADENTLNTEPYAAEKSDWDAFERLFFTFLLVAVNDLFWLAANFIAVADQKCVVAHVVKHDFVLKHYDNDCE